MLPISRVPFSPPPPLTAKTPPPLTLAADAAPPSSSRDTFGSTPFPFRVLASCKKETKSVSLSQEKRDRFFSVWRKGSDRGTRERMNHFQPGYIGGGGGSLSLEREEGEKIFDYLPPCTLRSKIARGVTPRTSKTCRVLVLKYVCHKPVTYQGSRGRGSVARELGELFDQVKSLLYRELSDRNAFLVLRLNRQVFLL